MSLKDGIDKIKDQCRDAFDEARDKADCAVQTTKLKASALALGAVALASLTQAPDAAADTHITAAGLASAGLTANRLREQFEQGVIGRVDTIEKAAAYSDTCKYGVVMIGTGHKYAPRLLKNRLSEVKTDPKYAQYGVKILGLEVDELTVGTSMYLTCGSTAHLDVHGRYTGKPGTYKWTQTSATLLDLAETQAALTSIIWRKTGKNLDIIKNDNELAPSFPDTYIEHYNRDYPNNNFNQVLREAVESVEVADVSKPNLPILAAK